jgi:hypothetical protein
LKFLTRKWQVLQKNPIQDMFSEQVLWFLRTIALGFIYSDPHLPVLFWKRKNCTRHGFDPCIWCCQVLCSWSANIWWSSLTELIPDELCTLHKEWFLFTHRSSFFSRCDNCLKNWKILQIVCFSGFFLHKNALRIAVQTLESSHSSFLICS